MCGIVGHIGANNSVDVLLTGLTRLEYRGYDSAGISFRNPNGELQTIKKEGKISALKQLVQEDYPIAHSGIGHTRWATHGAVNDLNAHPHSRDGVALVVNGIIENFHELRKELADQGHTFKSETDSEVFLELIHFHLTQNKNLLEAVKSAYSKVEGNYAFVVYDHETEKIYAVKKGAPLVCGENSKTNEVFVSSDPYALVGYADKLIFPEDNVFCQLENGKKIAFQEQDGSSSTRIMERAQLMEIGPSEKGSFEHYMLKEIFEQPDRIRNFLNFYMEGKGLELIVEATKEKFKRVYIVACGTAWHAGLVVKKYLENANRINTTVELASEFRYGDPILEKSDLAIFISQSGETADTLAALDLCLERGLRTINIGNVEGATQFRKCHHNLMIQAGVEIGVASTKAFTLMGLTGFIFSQILLKGSGEEARNDIYKKIGLLADKTESLLKDAETIQKIGEKIYNKRGFLFTGRGDYFPITLEGALKLKEIAYVHAEGYAGGELKHGPIALIDEEMVNVAIMGPELLSKMISNVEEVRARRGIIVGIGPKNNKQLEELCAHYIGLDFEGLGELGPLYANVVCQLLSYYVARERGTDIDQPRNLAKSVTVE